jgi:hypothetical protein
MRHNRSVPPCPLFLFLAILTQASQRNGLRRRSALPCGYELGITVFKCARARGASRSPRGTFCLISASLCRYGSKTR